MIDRVGQQLGKYRLLSVLGRGSFAEVYLGQHIHLQSLAAVKILHTRLDSESVTAFQKEAQIIARLRHPNIIIIHDFDVEAETPFLVMDYAQNGSLRGTYRSGSILPPSIILPYVKQIASALQYAHTHKVIHRDIKPANMLIGLDNTILLSDFGLAVVTQSSLQSQLRDVAGTMAYMAPEQFTGKPVPASDQYALAVVVYEWLCGVRPFTGTAQEMEALHRSAPPPSLFERVPTLSPAIEQVVMTALAKNPGKRFKNVAAFASALENACRPDDVIIIRELQSSTPSAVPSFPEAFPQIWNIPHRRNPLFTGREAILENIGKSLAKNQAVMLAQAITGLGGIGKTQTALEYAYRNHDNYRAVLWVRADTPEVLHADFATLAGVLKLFKTQEQDQSIAVKAVQRWLQENSNWLLIIDNVEKPEIVDELLPAHHHGHVLLTTRSQATGPTAQRFNLEKMPPHVGALFLLRRTQIIRYDQSLDDAPPEARRTALDISITLDGLPLALDQAGSYIESAECGLQGFIERYQQHQAELLKHRGRLATPGDHPIPVYTTLELCFELVAHASTAAKDLLQMCAFLYADSIPEEIFSAGASELTRALRLVVGDTLKFDTAIIELRKYSLIRRNPDLHTLTVHRLVQAILKDRMSSASRHQWAERAVCAINRAFPDVTFEHWQICERLLPHAQTCVGYIEEWDMQFPEAIRLLEQTGNYLRDRAQYEQAEPLYQHILSIYEQTLGPDQLESTKSMDELANLYQQMGKYELSESLYRRALDIRDKNLPQDHLDRAASLQYLARLCYFTGTISYAQAERLLHQALSIRQSILGAEHLDIAQIQEDLADLYCYQGKYTEAEPLYQQSLSIRKNLLGSQHPDIGRILYYLAKVYHWQAQFAQAEPLYEQARAVFEKATGPDHPEVGLILDNTALFYLDQGKYTQAEPLFLQALAIHENAFGLVHPHIAKCLNNLCLLNLYQGKYAQAEIYGKRALSIHEQTVGPEHTDMSIVLDTLSRIYLVLGKYSQARTCLERVLFLLERDTRPDSPALGNGYCQMGHLCVFEGKYSEAEKFYQQALAIQQKSLGYNTFEVAEVLHGIASCLYELGRYDEANTRCNEALVICEKIFGKDHPDTAHFLNTLALLQSVQGFQEDAEHLSEWTLRFFEQLLGARHPRVAESLYILARVYQSQHNFGKSRPLYQRALNILEHAFGKEHPDIARILHGQAELALLQDQHPQAEKLEKRALAMREKLLGMEHPESAESLSTLAEIYRALGKNDRAGTYYHRALRICENALGNMHPDTIKNKKTLADLQDGK